VTPPAVQPNGPGQTGTQPSSIIDWSDKYENYEGHGRKARHETKVHPSATWVKDFVGDLAITDHAHNPNSGIQVMLPGGDNSKTKMTH
jgi:hypothetical protein